MRCFRLTGNRVFVTEFRSIVFVFLLGMILTSLTGGSVPAYGESSAGGFPRTVLVNGEPVVIPAQPMRIAAVSGDVADIVLELVDPNRLAVVPIYMDNPSIYRNYEKAGTIQNRIASAVDLDPEAVLAYDPDLIIITLRQTAEIDSLKLLRLSGIPIIGISDWSDFDALKANIELIGQAVGEDEAAGRIVQDIDERLERIEQRLQGVTPREVLPLSIFSPDGTTPFFIPSTSFKYDVLRRAGASSTGDRLGITRLVRASIEQIMQADPTFMLLSDWAGTGAEAYGAFLGHPAMQAVTAVVEDKVLVLPYRELWATLDAVDGVEKIAQWLYPDRF